MSKFRFLWLGNFVAFPTLLYYYIINSIVCQNLRR
nr:MAG TPA: hypothetical protein [Caudoviricetes sp.]